MTDVPTVSGCAGVPMQRVPGAGAMVTTEKTVSSRKAMGNAR